MRARETRISLVAGAMILAVSAWALPASASIIVDLGQAGSYAVFGFNGRGQKDTDISITSSQVTGGVALGPDANGIAYSSQQVSLSSSSVDGGVYIQSPAKYSISGGSTPTTANFVNLAQSVSDAVAASAAAASLSATQTFAATIKSSTTISGNGGLNVISTKGITLGSEMKLTLSGGASDVFVINVASGSAMTLTGGASIDLAGGVTADHVLFNVLGSTGGDVAFSGGSGADIWNGTILATQRKIQFHDSIENGALIGGNDIAITSDGTVNYVGFADVRPSIGLTVPADYMVITGCPGKTLSTTVTNTAPVNFPDLVYTATASVTSGSATLGPVMPGSGTISAGNSAVNSVAVSGGAIGLNKIRITVDDPQAGNGPQYVEANYIVLDHSLAQFVGGGTHLTLDFGTLQQNSGIHSLQYQIENALAAYRAGLDCDGIIGVSNPVGVFTTNASTFSDLASGSYSSLFDVFVSTAQTGRLEASFEFDFSDQDGLCGSVMGQKLTLDVTAEVQAVPEPATLTLLCVGGLALIRRRRVR